MRKILFITFCVLFIMNIMAEEKKVSLGFKTDATLSNFISKEKDMNTHMRVGGAVGPMFIIRCSEKIAVQTELSLIYLTSKFPTVLYPHYESWGIELPVYVLRKIPVNSDFKFMAGGGMFMDYTFSASLNEIQELIKTRKEDFPMNKFNYGINVLCGIDVFNQLQVYVAYKIGLHSIANRSLNVRMIPQRIHIGIGFHF